MCRNTKPGVCRPISTAGNTLTMESIPHITPLPRPFKNIKTKASVYLLLSHRLKYNMKHQFPVTSALYPQTTAGIIGPIAIEPAEAFLSSYWWNLFKSNSTFDLLLPLQHLQLFQHFIFWILFGTLERGWPVWDLILLSSCSKIFFLTCFFFVLSCLYILLIFFGFSPV